MEAYFGYDASKYIDSFFRWPPKHLSAALNTGIDMIFKVENNKGFMYEIFFLSFSGVP